MHIIAGAILVLFGAAAVAYIARGASAFEREPPLLALGVMLVTVGIGLCGRSRAAGLVARIGIGATLLVMGSSLVSGWATSGPASTDEGLVRYAQLLGLATAAAVLVGVFLLVRRAPRRASFGPIDIAPVAGLAAALTLGAIWLLGNEADLRPCRLGNELACQQIATRLIESAERSPSTRPTAWETRAALVLATELCPVASEPGPCGARRYAVGAVALRAGRLDAAKAAFRQACDFERSWCARAAQETAVPWTTEELQRLQRRARP
jgi:hypothetical protein